MRLNLDLEGVCEKCGQEISLVIKDQREDRVILAAEPCQRCLDKIADDDSNYIRGYNDGVESCEK